MGDARKSIHLRRVFLRAEKSRVIFSVMSEFLASSFAFLDAFIAAAWEKPFAFLSLTIRSQHNTWYWSPARLGGSRIDHG